ncbi:MAG: hypothetical protein ACR2F6_06355 [Mycobacteriales bacterium]
MDWTDTDGWEPSSRLVTLDQARAESSNDLLDLVYLDMFDTGVSSKWIDPHR